MKKFVLRKGEHLVDTVDAIEAVNLRARGYTDVKPEPVKAPTIKTTTKSKVIKTEEPSEK